jgi:2-desacetyl-2-hydroxyethyl bacteriochlorophyllide A dehydrogenase
MARGRPYTLGRPGLNMKRLSLEFSKPHQVTVTEELLPGPAPHQVLVQTTCSAISPGTEMLVYRGQWPESLLLDETIPALARRFSYPLKYGYSCVGRIVEIGSEVDSQWLDKQVFAFNPHESYFLTSPDQLIPLPLSMPPSEAALLPNMETAVNLVMDGKPLIGEQVAVFGQGVVGLLTTAVLGRFPLACLLTVDGYSLRRQRSLEFGATESLDPGGVDIIDGLRKWVQAEQPGSGFDLTYELSGNPTALNQAISATGFGGRVVIGSWYGSKRADLELGGRFHRDRIKLISSQVSHLAPEFTGLWTKSRRLAFALRMLEESRPSSLITHRFSILQAAAAYDLLDRMPEEAIQIIFSYEDVG